MSYADWRQKLYGALDSRFYTIHWLDWIVMTGQGKVFLNETSCGIAEIRSYPSTAKEVHVIVAAGDIEGILALRPEFEAWGRECGAITAAVDSREAWGELMAPLGYNTYQICLKKDL